MTTLQLQHKMVFTVLRRVQCWSPRFLRQFGTLGTTQYFSKLSQNPIDGIAPGVPASEEVNRIGNRDESRNTSTQLTPGSVVFSGIQPTGPPHLGNYLGALRQWVRIQEEAPTDTKLIFSIVDLHALTVPFKLCPGESGPNKLRRYKREGLATLMAVGLRPERCILFWQSDVSFSF